MASGAFRFVHAGDFQLHQPLYGVSEVPAHLRDSHYQAAATIGHGVGYEYPHDHAGAVVDQQYLPDELVDRHWYEPSPYGAEQEISRRMTTRPTTENSVTEQR